MDKLRIVSCKLDSDLESSKKQHTQLVDQCEELKQGREEFMIVAIIHCLTCYMECPMALLVCAFVVVLTILINDIPCVVEIVTDRKLVKDKPTRNSGSKYGEMLREYVDMVKPAIRMVGGNRQMRIRPNVNRGGLQSGGGGWEWLDGFRRGRT
ncbi:hypothetical protein JHK85_016952 [Glycine max]|nr:hypothetical protein JHK85_016952 [Glycine max]